MKLIIEKSVTVITPTVGSPKLRDAIRSVQEQTYSNIDHLIVIDGDQYFDNAWHELYAEYSPINAKKTVTVIKLPHNTGKTDSNFYGHRIYAGIPHLINADYIFFLDEDNWYDPDHVKSLVSVLDQGNDFAYSLRKIYNPDKTYVCDDNCEALGKWPIYMTFDKQPQMLIDTSAFAFNRKFLNKTSHHWHHGWGGDRHYLYNALNYNPKWDCNRKHTLCYRLDGNPNSVTADFFLLGNEQQLKNYNGELPWLKT